MRDDSHRCTCGREFTTENGLGTHWAWLWRKGVDRSTHGRAAPDSRAHWWLCLRWCVCAATPSDSETRDEGSVTCPECRRLLAIAAKETKP